MEPFDLFHQMKALVQWDDESFDLWRFRSPNEMLKEKKAKCIDITCYLHDLVPESEVILYRLERTDGLPIHVRDDEETQTTWIHVNLLFPSKGKFYIAEWKWFRLTEILGPFESKDEALNDCCELMKQSLDDFFNTSFVVDIVPFKQPPYGLSLNDFQAYVLGSDH